MVTTASSRLQRMGFLDALRWLGSGHGTCDGISFHFARQTGQIWFPYLTFEAMQWKWNEWEHSAVNIA